MLSGLGRLPNPPRASHAKVALCSFADSGYLPQGQLLLFHLLYQHISGRAYILHRIRRNLESSKSVERVGSAQIKRVSLYQISRPEKKAADTQQTKKKKKK